MVKTDFLASLICFLWLCLVSTALHLSPRGQNYSLGENVGISAELLHQFSLIAQYAAAAYCPDNNNSTATPIVCPTGNCPLVEMAGAHSVQEFENDPRFDDTGFVTIDDVNRLIVLSFRGSVSDPNWREDFKFIRVHTDMCPKCHIHHGYWESWMGIRDSVTVTAVQALNAYPSYRFIVTGHSLGGALATLAAADFRRYNDDVAKRTELYTYGSPRVGNEAAAAFFSGQSSLSFRITSMADPIPRMPGHILGYYHTSPEYWINHNPHNPGTQDINILTGFYNKSGNSGTTGFNFDYHEHYFMPSISLCNNVEDTS